MSFINVRAKKVRAKKYGIAEARIACWRCTQQTRVYGIILYGGHQVLESIKEQDIDIESEEARELWLNTTVSSEWLERRNCAFAYYIAYVNNAVVSHLWTYTKNYFINS